MKSEAQTAKDLATTTAQQATDVANIAMKTAADLAAKTVETTTRIETNMGWMMKSLTNIETTLAEMQKAFVTATQHTEVLKRLDDIEPRVTKLEFWRSTLIASWGVAAALLTFFYFQLAQPFISEVVRHINGR
jgi:phage-related minor tail protein